MAAGLAHFREDGRIAPWLHPSDRETGVAYSLLGDSAEAEDAVQEAALLAFRNFASFEPGTNFRAWFFRILTNWCFGRHRQRKRRP